MMICEGSSPPESKVQLSNPSVVGHLDKSHITVHTYPEYHPDGGVCTFRADIDVSTCGEISPLTALNYLIESFETDIITSSFFNNLEIYIKRCG
jgi:S-adenosylmethionine decarboxylase